MSNTAILELPRTYVAPSVVRHQSRLERLVERQHAARACDLALGLTSFAFALFVVFALVGI